MERTIPQAINATKNMAIVAIPIAEIFPNHFIQVMFFFRPQNQRPANVRKTQPYIPAKINQIKMTRPAPIFQILEMFALTIRFIS